MPEASASRGGGKGQSGRVAEAGPARLSLTVKPPRIVSHLPRSSTQQLRMTCFIHVARCTPLSNTHPMFQESGVGMHVYQRHGVPWTGGGLLPCSDRSSCCSNAAPPLKAVTRSSSIRDQSLTSFEVGISLAGLRLGKANGPQKKQ